MKGENKSIIQLLDGSEKRYTIPVYQRNYSWKKQNCEQLLNDLISVINNNRNSHFFGSIVYIYKENSEFEVIDGQQRLTTVSLIALAIRNLLKKDEKDEIKVADKNKLIDKIEEQFLISKYLDSPEKIKLKPIDKDSKSYMSLFNTEDEPEINSNIVINYNYFYNKIKEIKLDVEKLYEALKKLSVITIELKFGEDDPQLIFESLNSTGLALSESDKIRNLILMGLDIEKQNDYFNNYWVKIEENTENNNINFTSDFIRDFLILKTNTIPNKNNVYFDFKNYYLNENNTENLLKELTKYSKYYHNILVGDGYNNNINQSLKRLNSLETNIIRPFLLGMFNLFNENLIDEDTVKKVLLLTESYIFRRIICDYPTNALNKIFAVLYKDIVKFDNNISDFYEKYLYLLCSRDGKGYFPDDKMFENKLKDKDIYINFATKNKNYLFERLENYDSLETTDVSKYTIEHIMPQHLTNKWKDNLGSDAENIHSIWLHKLANLTLTAYNSKYSDNDFITKRDMEHGFKDSGIKLNNYLQQLDKWDLEELEKRNKYLSEKALKIWQKPVSSYIPKSKIEKFYTLDDEIDFTGKKIKSFSFRDNAKENVNGNWTKMLFRVIECLFDENNVIILNLANNKELRFYNIDKGVNKDRILDNLYIDTTCDTKTKISLLKKLFDLYDIDYNELVFYLKDE